MIKKWVTGWPMRSPFHCRNVWVRPAAGRKLIGGSFPGAVGGETIHRSPDPDIEVPATDVTSYVLEGAGERGDKPALIDGPSGRELSYAALADGVGRLAGGLK